jgi:hypothetical protein
MEVDHFLKNGRQKNKAMFIAWASLNPSGGGTCQAQSQPGRETDSNQFLQKAGL